MSLYISLVFLELLPLIEAHVHGHITFSMPHIFITSFHLACLTVTSSYATFLRKSIPSTARRQFFQMRNSKYY